MLWQVNSASLWWPWALAFVSPHISVISCVSELKRAHPWAGAKAAVLVPGGKMQLRNSVAHNLSISFGEQWESWSPGVQSRAMDSLEPDTQI